MDNCEIIQLLIDAVSYLTYHSDPTDPACHDTLLTIHRCTSALLINKQKHVEVEPSSELSLSEIINNHYK